MGKLYLLEDYSPLAARSGVTKETNKDPGIHWGIPKNLALRHFILKNSYLRMYFAIEKCDRKMLKYFFQNISKIGIYQNANILIPLTTVIEQRVLNISNKGFWMWSELKIEQELVIVGHTDNVYRLKCSYRFKE